MHGNSSFNQYGKSKYPSERGRGKIIVDEYDSMNFMKFKQKEEEFACGFCNQEIPSRFMVFYLYDNADFA